MRLVGLRPGWQIILESFIGSWLIFEALSCGIKTNCWREMHPMLEQIQALTRSCSRMKLFSHTRSRRWGQSSAEALETGALLQILEERQVLCAEFHLQCVGKEKNEDLRYITFGCPGKLSKAIFFFFDSFGTTIKLYKGIGPGKHPAVVFRGFIICLASAQPTGDRVSFSELFNLYPSSCLACDETCEVAVCLWDGQAVGRGSPEPAGLAGMARRTLSWQAVTARGLVAQEMVWEREKTFLLLGVSKSTKCQLPICHHWLWISLRSFFFPISPSCTHLVGFQSLSASAENRRRKQPSTGQRGLVPGRKLQFLFPKQLYSGVAPLGWFLVFPSKELQAESHAISISGGSQALDSLDWAHIWPCFEQQIGLKTWASFLPEYFDETCVSLLMMMLISLEYLLLKAVKRGTMPCFTCFDLGFIYLMNHIPSNL